jgi:hypothetical protein
MTKQDWIERYLNEALRNGWITHKDKQNYQPNDNIDLLIKDYPTQPEAAATYVATWFETQQTPAPTNPQTKPPHTIHKGDNTTKSHKLTSKETNSHPQSNRPPQAPPKNPAPPPQEPPPTPSPQNQDKLRQAHLLIRMAMDEIEDQPALEPIYNDMRSTADLIRAILTQSKKNQPRPN